MDTAIIQIISSVGFPIVACMGCGWYINKQDSRHRNEIDKITDALNNNTIALTRLLDKLGADENENKNN